jgi:hypothetical protein
MPRRWLVMGGLLLAGVLVYLPSLRCHYLLDDYLQAAMIEGTFPAPRGPLDLYNFVDERERPLLFDRGMLPWWTDPHIRIRFLRPLPSALRWVEQHVVGRAPLPPHLHSFAWWFAAVLAARALFRRLLPARAALLATLVFAFAPCHALPLAWLANREALISLTFGALALSAYLRWRERGGVATASAAAGLFAASMAGGEYALCFGGFVLAFELFAHRDGLARRILGLVPFTVSAAAYLGLRAALGYGAQGSGFYADPLSEPMTFLRLAPRRLVTLVADEWLTLDGDTLQNAAPWLLALIVVGLVALVASPLQRALAGLDGQARRRTVATLVGSVLALLPLLAVQPSPRVLAAGLLGAAPAIGLVLDCAWFPASPPERRGAAELAGLVALALGFAHFVHGPMTAWTIGEGYRRSSSAFEAGVADLGRRLGEATASELVVVRGSNGSFFMPFALDPHAKRPDRWRILAATGHVLGLRRDARTLELVAPKDQGFYAWEPLFRDRGTEVRPGEVFETPGLRVTVLEVGPQGPRRARFELDRDLDASGYVWIAESGQGEFPAVSPPLAGFGQQYDP